VTPVEAKRYIEEAMKPYYPLSVFRDRSKEDA
jgi:hypothetical protein